MPHVSIKMYPGRTDEQKKALTNRIVRAMEETIGTDAKSISVSFEEIAPEEWDEAVVKPDIAGKRNFFLNHRNTNQNILHNRERVWM